MSNELPQEVRKEIGSLSNNDKDDELVKYMDAKLNEGVINAEQVFDYANRYKFIKKAGKPFVIKASTINKLGVVVPKLSDKTQSQLSVKFYKLAADRNSDWGCANYARLLIDEDLDGALTYARKAVQLTQGGFMVEKDKHKWVLGKMLMKKSDYKSAFIAIAEYFSSKIYEYNSGSNKTEKDKVVSDISPKLKIAIKILQDQLLQYVEKKKGLEQEGALLFIELMEPSQLR